MFLKYVNLSMGSKVHFNSSWKGVGKRTRRKVTLLKPGEKRAQASQQKTKEVSFVAGSKRFVGRDRVCHVTANVSTPLRPPITAVFSCRIDHCLLCLGRLVRPRSSRLSPVVTARSGRSLAPLWKRSRRRFSATLSIVDAFRSAVYRLR